MVSLLWVEIDSNGRRGPLKTKRSERCVEVTNELTEQLRRAKVFAQASGRHDFVFVTKRGALRTITATSAGGRSAAL